MTIFTDFDQIQRHGYRHFHSSYRRRNDYQKFNARVSVFIIWIIAVSFSICTSFKKTRKFFLEDIKQLSIERKNGWSYSMRTSAGELSNLQTLNVLATKLAETPDHIVQLSLQSNVQKLANHLMNHSLVYFPGPWDGSGIVIEEFKLIFFTQGKVACTVFKQLFRRMMKKKDWRIENGKLPHNPKENGLKYLYHYNVADAMTILTHPNWTRALMVRDPKERVLSAFLDKAARKKGKYVQRHCCNQNNSTCGEDANASFLGFLKLIQNRCCCDPHWIAQTKRIDIPFRSYINFIGHFDNLQHDTKRLLDTLSANLNDMNIDNNDTTKINLWKTYGASGWGLQKNESIFSRSTKAKHETSALKKLKQYYHDPRIETFVEEIYADDYSDPLLNFKLFSINGPKR